MTSDEPEKLMGKQVEIHTKSGETISGIFVAERRLYEYSRDPIFVIQLSEGVHAYIRRDDISYIVVSTVGIVSDMEFETKSINSRN